MPVILGEISTLTNPLSGVRIWALVSGCITFSLVASMDIPPETRHLTLYRTFCMFVWCFFFTLTFLILAITYIQFHSLLPLSWKNLTVTVAALASLMCLAATLAFPWMVTSSAAQRAAEPRKVAASASSSLTSLAYATETYLIRFQSQEQRGYMASLPGLLKVVQVFGGCVLLLLVVDQSEEGNAAWKLCVTGSAYALCLLVSLGTVVVMLGECAGRCLVPFDRLLAAFGVLGVLLYMMAAVVCSTKVLQLQDPGTTAARVAVICEMVLSCITLLAYTIDLAFSVKLLCDRN
ncbi:myeloid-associated differentiation marker homolog [Denticeps clupeoides]|uniref:MARVEL domain-containing protein n=1 Tax=Denticeps clupeoides TaxID=299321 RepID=A0AAY4ACJ4_9TELE|nr:myeloid-associated differentiation marker homolog [Denticeps clupeoides]